jgi:hypothetical protein
MIHKRGKSVLVDPVQPTLGLIGELLHEVLGQSRNVSVRSRSGGRSIRITFRR